MRVYNNRTRGLNYVIVNFLNDFIQIAKFEHYAHGHVTALLGDIIHKFLFQKQRI